MLNKAHECKYQILSQIFSNLGNDFCLGVLGPVYHERRRQLCDDASDTALNENNGVTP